MASAGLNVEVGRAVGVGVGCGMSNNETGDGVVKKNSSYLSIAENFEIEGVCKGKKFQFLHDDMLDPELYPAVYDKIVEILMI